MEILDLDFILGYMAEHKLYFTAGTLKLHSKYKTEIELAVALEKLYRDGYVNRFVTKRNNPNDFQMFETSDLIQYYISYDGLLFIEQGGYAQFTARHQANEEFKIKSSKTQHALNKTQVWGTIIQTAFIILTGIAAVATWKIADSEHVLHEREYYDNKRPDTKKGNDTQNNKLNVVLDSVVTHDRVRLKN